MLTILCILLTISFIILILLCVAMFIIASIMDNESWKHNDMGKR